MVSMSPVKALSRRKTLSFFHFWRLCGWWKRQGLTLLQDGSVGIMLGKVVWFVFVLFLSKPEAKHVVDMSDWKLDSLDRFMDLELLHKVEERSIFQVWQARGANGALVRLVVLSPRATRNLGSFPGDRTRVSRPHPRIAGLVDCGIHGEDEAGERAYIILDWLDADRLSSLMTQGPVWSRSEVVDKALMLAMHVSAVMEDLECDSSNKAGWIPGHLNPDGIWLGRDGVPFLEHPLLSQTLSELQGISLKGAARSLGYMSPEQVGGRTLDMRSDLFSFGVVLYEVLTAERLFTGESRSQIVARVKEASVPRPSQRCPWIEEGVSDLVLAALARDVDARPKTWASWRKDLMVLAQQRGMAVSAPAGQAVQADGTVVGLADERETEILPDEASPVPVVASGSSLVSGQVSRDDRPMQNWMVQNTMEAALHPDMMTRATGANPVAGDVFTPSRRSWWLHWAWEAGLAALLLVAVFLLGYRVVAKKGQNHSGAKKAAEEGSTSKSDRDWKIISSDAAGQGLVRIVVAPRSPSVGSVRVARPMVPGIAVAGRCVEPRYWVLSHADAWQAVFFVPDKGGSPKLEFCHNE